jgi:hypothetical protein
MPSAGFRLGLPPPALVVESSVEDVVTATKITVTRAGTVTHLGGWIEGNAAGVDPEQPIRFHLYADIGGLNPGTFLCRTIQTTVSGLRPGEQCIRVAVEGAPIHIVPGTYWVGVNVGSGAGTGELILYGEATAPGIRKRNANAYPAQPSPFPLGGVVTTNGQSAAVGLVFTQDPTEITGSIVGTFLVGTRLVGEVNIPFNTSTLFLNGQTTGVIATNDFKVASMGKPKLLLRGKTTQVFVTLAVVLNPGRLILKGKTTAGVIPPIVYFPLTPDLILRGKAATVAVSIELSFGTPKLYLLGRVTVGKIPGLVPSVPGSIILVPTEDYPPLDLEPAETDSILLVPTTTVIT